MTGGSVSNVKGKGKMGDIIIKLHISMMQFAQRRQASEDGFTTAELLANAALGVAALAVIWGLIQRMFPELMDSIKSSMGLS